MSGLVYITKGSARGAPNAISNLALGLCNPRAFSPVASDVTFFHVYFLYFRTFSLKRIIQKPSFKSRATAIRQRTLHIRDSLGTNNTFFNILIFDIIYFFNNVIMIFLQ